MRNALKYGGYAMLLTETTRRVREFQERKARERRRRTARDLVIGATVGTAVGAAAGVLFAPRSGAETRRELGRKAGEQLQDAKETLANQTGAVATAVRSRKDEYLEIAEKCADAIREVHKEAARDRGGR
jgi:gas vesicle protein